MTVVATDLSTNGAGVFRSSHGTGVASVPASIHPKAFVSVPVSGTPTLSEPNSLPSAGGVANRHAIICSKDEVANVECGEKGIPSVLGPTVGGVPTGAASVVTCPGGTNSTNEERSSNLPSEASLTVVHTSSTTRSAKVSTYTKKKQFPPKHCENKSHTK